MVSVELKESEASPSIYRLSEWKMILETYNVSAKVWANLDNPIKSYDFWKFWINFLYAALSGGTLLQSVMSQQYKVCLMELYSNFTKFYFSWKYIFTLPLYLGMLGLRLLRISYLKLIIQICWKFLLNWVSKIIFYSPNPHCCLRKLHSLHKFALHIALPKKNHEK